MLVSMFARGHCLLVGVPGLAKTLMIRTLAESLSLSFNRIQFTPDLMPSDITGTEVIQEDRTSGEREYRFLPGPVFANVVLADEINRTPPKTQAALLEAMQEHQVTAGEKKDTRAEPVFGLATQEIVRRTTDDSEVSVTPTLDADAIFELTRIVRRVPIADHVARYALRLARLSRAGADDTPEFIREYVMWGAGPRASQYLVLGAKARAALHGRYCASQEDVRAVVFPVLRHRIKTTFNADAEGITVDDIVLRILDSVPEVKGEDERGQLPQVFRSADAG
jgi:MoxR-like ATPase